MNTFKGFISDLSHGITPSKRKELDKQYMCEVEERLKKHEDTLRESKSMIIKHYDNSPVAHACLESVFSGIGNLHINNKDYVISVTCDGTRFIDRNHASDEHDDVFYIFSFKDNGYAPIKVNNLCIFTEWIYTNISNKTNNKIQIKKYISRRELDKEPHAIDPESNYPIMTSLRVDSIYHAYLFKDMERDFIGVENLSYEIHISLSAPIEQLCDDSNLKEW